MKILINPTAIWTPTGSQDANVFEVRYVNYTGPGAVADCHLFKDEVELSTIGLVPASQEQCDAWTNDDDFAASIAVTCGISPVVPTTPWTPPVPEVTVP